MPPKRKRGPVRQVDRKSFEPTQRVLLKKSDKGSYYGQNDIEYSESSDDDVITERLISTPDPRPLQSPPPAPTKLHKLLRESSPLTDSDTENIQPRDDGCVYGSIPSKVYDTDSESCDDSDSNSDSDQEPSISDYKRIIFDVQCLIDCLQTAAVCRICKTGALDIEHIRSWGWGKCLRWVCVECGYRHETFSNAVRPEINEDLVIAMRAIGKGQSGAVKFSSFMGLSKPIGRESYAKHVNTVANTIKETCKQQLNNAANESRMIGGRPDTPATPNTTLITDIAITIDGSWLTRGFASRHGVVCAMSLESGKIVDCHHLSSVCRECEKWTGKDQTSMEYMTWWLDHELDCTMNHEGSAASMECAGALVLYRRSISRYNLRYNPYVGDGDSKSYSTVNNSQPYGAAVQIVKEECVGHIQKRMGTKLRNLMTNYKGTYVIVYESIYTLIITIHQNRNCPIISYIVYFIDQFAEPIIVF
jgi:hypothetical protein